MRIIILAQLIVIFFTAPQKIARFLTQTFVCSFHF